MFLDICWKVRRELDVFQRCDINEYKRLLAEKRLFSLENYSLKQLHGNLARIINATDFKKLDSMEESIKTIDKLILKEVTTYNNIIKLIVED